ncbi:ABC transporter permease subunit [Isoptericola sp. 178]|uniref:ABC transporter permease subunit n=1 Tax=Isoptericola sp. 178 TaxID=3064651 RepID=UPI0027129806|nr:ABC transporter permease subunit [Isoptericola sp. 178]MDO8145521.1 ABC transporter permease subunit [Isoptericola sp. 178]
MRLVRVELRRLWMRRVTWGGLLLALVVAGLAVVTQVGAAQPPSAQEIAQAEQFYADQVEWWQENGAQETASCREAQAAEPGADYGCDRLEPRLEQFLPSSSTFVSHETSGSSATGGLTGTETAAAAVSAEVAAVQESLWSGWSSLSAAARSAAPAFLMLAFVVGVSFVTAEQRTGALGLWLTFEPRRSRVYGSKAAAAALGTAPLVLGGWLATVGGLYALHAAAGTLGTVSGADWAEIAAFSGRLLLAGALCAAAGVALGVLLRHAASAIGGVALLLWASAGFAFTLGAAQRWLPVLNLDAWLRGGAIYQYPARAADPSGEASVPWLAGVVDGVHGGLYWLAVVAVLTLVAGAVFRRRDLD